jgi:hypothetical protein
VPRSVSDRKARERSAASDTGNTLIAAAGRPSSSATKATSQLATLPGSLKARSSVASARSRPPEKRAYMSGALSNKSRATVATSS